MDEKWNKINEFFNNNSKKNKNDMNGKKMNSINNDEKINLFQPNGMT